MIFSSDITASTTTDTTKNTVTIKNSNTIENFSDLIKNHLAARLNNGPKRLQNIAGNPFDVTDDLFLKESDFS